MTALRRLLALEFPAWVVGGVVSVAAAAAYLLGWSIVHDTEARATDLLFRHGRPDPPPPHPAIVHVDIDDGSLDTEGRWPWPRSKLADAIRALDGYGPRVIVLDILFSEPQEPTYRADGTKIDHDALLERAFAEARARVILAVDLDFTLVRLGPAWRGPEGRRDWERVLDLLGRDLARSADDVVQELKLPPVRARRVRAKIRTIKRIVIRRTAALRFPDRAPELAEMSAILLPADAGRYVPERVLLETEVARARAAALFERRLPATQQGVDYRRADAVIPPLPRFAAAAHGAGVVDADPDPDGQMRRVQLRVAEGGHVYPQLGLAAALAYLDASLEPLADPRIVVRRGDESISFGDGEFLLSWPRIDPAGQALGFARHIQMGLVLDVDRKKGAVAELRRRRDELGRALAAAFLETEAWNAEVLAELRDDVAFRLEGVADEEGVDETTRALLTFRKLDREHARARREVARADTLLASSLSDRIVFVGWNASGNFGDFYPTLVHERTPGVVTHAIVANSVLSGYVVRTAPRWAGALLTLLLGLLAAFATTRTGPRLAFLLTVLLASLYVMVNTLVVFAAFDTALALSTPLFAVLAAWAATSIARAVLEKREKRQLRRQFGARVSKQLFEFLTQRPDLVSLAGEEREVTCFFSDLAGFTAISEQLDSQTTVALLNRYMRAMNEELTALDAYVNKFLGDGVMAVWGAFAQGTPHAAQAARAALRCYRRLEALNGEPDVAELPELSMRIGIATGVVIVGDCGAPPELHDYTVIGDAANLAARLESANKQFGTRILLDGRAHALLPEDDLVLRPLGRITVVGQQTPTDVYELLNTAADATDAERDLAARTEAAVAAFREGRLEEAQAAWAALLEAHGPSPLARIYLREIAIQQRAPDDAFDGVIHLESK